MDTLTSVESMTDEQLSEYAVQLSTKLAMVSRMNGGSGAVEQLQRLLSIARGQMMERAQATAFKQLMASRPSEIVSDPDMRPKEPEGTTPAPKKHTINRISVRRSDRPSSSINLMPEPSKDEPKP